MTPKQCIVLKSGDHQERRTRLRVSRTRPAVPTRKGNIHTTSTKFKDEAAKPIPPGKSFAWHVETFDFMVIEMTCFHAQLLRFACFWNLICVHSWWMIISIISIDKYIQYGPSFFSVVHRHFCINTNNDEVITSNRRHFCIITRT